MRHHRSLAAAVSLALLAAIPAAAAVRSEHTLTLRLSAKTPKKSTGVTITTSRTITPPPAPRVRKIVFALPAGTKFDTAAATRCSLATLQAQGARGCPAGSAIGGGTAAAIAGTPFDPLRQAVAVYATSSSGLAAILTGVQTAVLPLTVRDHRITAVLPRICRPPGSLPDCPSGDILLKDLDIGLNAKTKGTGSRLKRLITTPKTCVGGKWRSSATYTYSNGDTEVRRSNTNCRRR